MSAVKRWDVDLNDSHHCDCGACYSTIQKEADDGEYVLATDYDALAAECKALSKDAKFWRERSQQQEEDALNHGMDAGALAAECGRLKADYSEACADAMVVAHKLAASEAEVARLRGDAELAPGKVQVSTAALRQVLNALVSEGFRIRELQATRQPVELFADNPINVLIAEFNAAMTQEPRNES